MQIVHIPFALAIIKPEAHVLQYKSSLQSKQFARQGVHEIPVLANPFGHTQLSEESTVVPGKH